MPKRCPKCGAIAMDDERFCTKCGENLINVVTYDLSEQKSVFSDPYQSQMSHPQSYLQQSESSDEMTLGKWFVTVLVTTLFGFISLIFLFIWGFGRGPESRKRYCKAMLIVKVISIGLTIAFVVFWTGVIRQIIYEYAYDYDYYYGNDGYSYYDDKYGSDAGSEVSV